jgi:hypothetical protein
MISDRRRKRRPAEARFTGILVKFADRGFGYLRTGSGREIFVDGRRLADNAAGAKVGEVFTFAITTNERGQPSAVDVRRVAGPVRYGCP